MQPHIATILIACMLALSGCTKKPPSPLTGKAVIQNPVIGYTLLMKDPDVGAASRDYMIEGKPASGSQVEILDYRKDPTDLVGWYQVRITSGEMKGKKGWVTDQNIQPLK